MIGQTSANELGKKAYMDGVDLFSSPSYLNAIEQEAWRQGYEDAMHAETLAFLVEDDEDSAVTPLTLADLDELSQMEWERDTFD